MPNLLVQGFDGGWTSTGPGLLDLAFTDRGMRLSARSGAVGTTAELTPAAPLDLTAFDELRLWTHSSRAADGGTGTPFLLELSYQDAGGAPGEEHRWLVPVNRRRTWEQHRFGIAGDRRGQVVRFTLRTLTDLPFVIQVEELLAVHEEVLSDVEAALTALLSDLAPVRYEETITDPDDLPDPVLLMTLTDQREDPARGWNIPQRDSFRLRGGGTVCSLRPAARPILVEYQVLPSAGDRAQSLRLRGEILRRIGVDTGMRVNGAVLPVQTLLPPPLDIRVRAVPAPVYLHIGARIEQGDRIEVPWVRRGRVQSGPLDRPWDPAGDEPPPLPDAEDQEGIVLRI